MTGDEAAPPGAASYVYAAGARSRAGVAKGIADMQNKVDEVFVGKVRLLSIDEVITSYYLRMRVEDKPGVLADITRILADSSISIEALIQKEAAEGEAHTDIIMLTHQTAEKNANAAIARIEALPVVQGKVVKLRMETL